MQHACISSVILPLAHIACNLQNRVLGAQNQSDARMRN